MNGNQKNLFLALFSVGQRVMAQPWTNSWMSGDRYGTVSKVGHVYVHVDMERSGKTVRFAPENLEPKDSHPVEQVYRRAEGSGNPYANVPDDDDQYTGPTFREQED